MSYTLPLNPVDLAEIYKIKADQDDYILHVDYEASKKVLSVKHILVYIANTNFKVQFNTIDAELINEYIKCDFLVECPIIARVIAIITKRKYDHDFNTVDDAINTVWSNDFIDEYLEQHGELLEDLLYTMQHIPLFCLDQSTKYDDKFKLFVPEDLEYTDVDTSVGLNIVYIATYALDLLYLLGMQNGPWPSSNLNKRVFNDASKYKGSDLYNTLLKQGVASSMLELFEEE
jgi:hypothetical protein|tara:strand:+ start:1795 stop:2487 length:693 start_codon:yes stop_codon:yes gene_type:complete